MLRRILIIGAAVIAVLALATYTVVPRHIGVSRSAVIEAEPERVFAVLNGFSEFNNWSPWNTDPEMKVEMSGPQFGVGARMTWHSEKEGSGAQEIIQSVQDREVAVRLSFEGFDTPTEARYVLEPQGDGASTKVTWSFGSDMGMNPINRWFGLIIESSVGGEYEQGLKNLKSYIEGAGAPQGEPEMGHTWLWPLVGPAGAAEAPPEDAPLPSSPALPPPPELMQPAVPGAELEIPNVPGAPEALVLLTPSNGAPGGEPELVTLAPRPICYVSAKTPNPEDAKNGAEVSRIMSEAFGKCMSFILGNGLTMSGVPLAITHNYVPGGAWEFDAAIPVAAAPASAPSAADGVKFGMTPGGKAVKAVHRGSYASVDEAYARIGAFAQKNGIGESKSSIEEYVSDPGETAEAELITNIYYLAP